MKVVLIAAGAGGMYCGSCLRDNALALELRALGHDAVLLPVYTPLRTDEENAAGGRVFLGALEVYLEAKFRFFRKIRFLRRLLNSRPVLGALARFGSGTNPRRLGRLAVSMLSGGELGARRSVADLLSWISDSIRPEVVHLSNALLSGLAPTLRRWGFPVVCGLQGEDLFVESLATGYREKAAALVRENAASVDLFIATSDWYADRAASLFGLERARIKVVRSGIRTADYESLPDPREGRPLTLGYFARIAPEKGLHVLAEAFDSLAGSFPDLRLRVAGYLPSSLVRWAAGIRRWLSGRGLGHRVEILGTLERREKLEFFRSLDVFSVPSVYPEAKALFVLEALACGVPVVEPSHGAFRELVSLTGGGILCEPGSSRDLAEKIGRLLADPALRKELGERGRAAVLAQFSGRRMAEETAALYSGIARSLPGPAISGERR